MWNIKQKLTKQTHRNKLTDTGNRSLVARGKRGLGKGKVGRGNQIYGPRLCGEHAIKYTDVEL